MLGQSLRRHFGARRPSVALFGVATDDDERDEEEGELPDDVQMGVAYDATMFMRAALKEISTTLVETILIVGLVVFLFMGSIRTALVPLVAMPVSLVGAALVMYAFGFSLNLLTLLAIVLSVGLLVDDAIVVVENVARHVREGRTRIEAALLGARELVGPVIAMTITLAAVYTPLAFQGGLTGSLFLEFAITHRPTASKKVVSSRTPPPARRAFEGCTAFAVDSLRAAAEHPASFNQVAG